MISRQDIIDNIKTVTIFFDDTENILMFCIFKERSFEIQVPKNIFLKIFNTMAIEDETVSMKKLFYRILAYKHDIEISFSIKNSYESIHSLDKEQHMFLDKEYYL